MCTPATGVRSNTTPPCASKRRRTISMSRAGKTPTSSTPRASNAGAEELSRDASPKAQRMGPNGPHMTSQSSDVESTPHFTSVCNSSSERPRLDDADTPSMQLKSTCEKNAQGTAANYNVKSGVIGVLGCRASVLSSASSWASKLDSSLAPPAPPISPVAPTLAWSAPTVSKTRRVSGPAVSGSNDAAATDSASAADAIVAIPSRGKRRIRP
eukprot:6196125-Pleurochrysis_carterae.AAC.3